MLSEVHVSTYQKWRLQWSTVESLLLIQTGRDLNIVDDRYPSFFQTELMKITKRDEISNEEEERMTGENSCSEIFSGNEEILSM